MKTSKCRLLNVEKSAMELYANEHKLDRMVFLQKLMNWMKLLVNQRSNTFWFDMCCNGVFNSISTFFFFQKGKYQCSIATCSIWTHLNEQWKEGAIPAIYKRLKCVHDTLWRENKFHPLPNRSYSLHFLLLDWLLLFFSLMSVCVFWSTYLFPFFGILKLHLHCFQR